MSKYHHWLAKQLPLWESDELITSEQSHALAKRHPITDSVGWGRLLLTGMGAIMIGLGVILLFAYNWAEMGKITKLTIIFGALAGAHIAGLRFVSGNKVLGEGFFAIGTMMMGASIFLVGQIYHMDSHYPDALLLWALGALALAWARPSLIQAFMAIVLVLTWHMVEVFDFRFANHTAFLLIAIGVFPLTWRLNSPILGRFASASLFVSLALSIGSVNSGLVTITILLFTLLVLCIEQYAKFNGDADQHLVAVEVAKPAGLVLAIILLLMTFDGFVKELVRFELKDSVSTSVFWFSLVSSQFGFAYLAFKRQLNGIVILTELAILLTFLPTLVWYLRGDDVYPGIFGLVPLGFNVILLATSVWLMYDGAKQANKRHMIRGSILFTILAMSRYTDLFDSLVARAVVFLLVGVALFAVGNIYQRNKAKVVP